MVMVFSFKNEHGQELVDYGVNVYTCETVILPPEDFKRFVKLNCYWSESLGGWILND